MKGLVSALFALYFLLISWTTAQAYIDAATGSMVLQLLLGGVAGFLVLMKLYWHRVKGYLGFKSSSTDGESSDASGS